MYLLGAAFLHELKIPRPDFGLAFQDRKNATITKSSLLPVLVVIGHLEKSE